MSSENRVENNLSALISRRSLRGSLDHAGMGFQEELLSLTFESSSEPPVAAAAPERTVRDQNANRSDDGNRTEEEANESRDREDPEFTFLFPATQLPVSNTLRGSPANDFDTDSGESVELVKGARSTDKIAEVGNKNPSEHRKQPANVVRERTSDEPEMSTEGLANASKSTAKELPKERLERSDEVPRRDGQQEPRHSPEAAVATETAATIEQPKIDVSKQRLTTAEKRTNADKVVEPIAEKVEPLNDRRAVNETDSTQDSLPNEQNGAPIRTRRNSRQDRLRDDAQGESKRNAAQSIPGRDGEMGASKGGDSSNRNDSYQTASGLVDVSVMQTSGAIPIDPNISVAGQLIANTLDGAVMNVASGAGAAGASTAGLGAASSTLTAGVVGGADKIVLGDNSTIQPTVGGASKGESLASTGRGSGRAEGATGTSTLSNFQQNKLVQRVLKGLEQLSSGGGQVKLRLHPPELGTLQMTLRIEGNVMSARLEVENSLAKDALLNNLQSLRDRLSEQGMRIDRFEVEVRTDSQSGAGGAFGDAESQQQSRRDQPESRYAIYNENRLSRDVAEEGEASTPWFRTNGKLDLSV